MNLGREMSSTPGRWYKSVEVEGNTLESLCLAGRISDEEEMIVKK